MHYLQRELYQKMQENSELFEWLQSGSLDGIWYWDLENQEEEWMSAHFKALFGYEDDEVPNKSSWWQEHIFPEDLPSVIRTFDAHVKRGLPYDQIVRYRHKEGHTIWVRCRGLAIRDADGRPIRMVGAHTDVTELMSAKVESQQEKRQRSSAEDLLSIVLRSTKLGLWDWDLGNNSVRFSGSWPTLTGFTPDHDAKPLDWQELVHPEDQADLSAAINHHIEHDGPGLEVSFRLSVDKQPGTWRWFELSGGAIQRSDTGQAIRLVCLLRDVHSDRSEKNELVEYASQSSRSDKLKSEFLATMSHEIRTPLNGILGMAEMLQNSELNDKQNAQLQTIRQCGESLLALINDVLDFSKIESGFITFEQQPFSIHELGQELTRIFMPQCERNGLDLSIKVASELPEFLLGDQFRLRQVLTNLLANAIKFTNSGHVLLTIEVEQSEDICIRCKDSGIGMSSAAMDSIFDPFIQSHSAAGRHYGGTGLGLSIAKRLIEGMGGSITVQSQINFGSEFIIRLPLKEGHATTKDTTSGDLVELEDLVILVVSGVNTNYQVLADILLGLGVTVRRAHDGFEALRLLRAKNDTFDALIVDHDLQDFDGATLCQVLNDDPNIVSLPVLLFGSGIDGQLQQGLNRIGVQAILTMPIVPSVLTGALRRLRKKSIQTLGQKQLKRVLIAEDNEINQSILLYQIETVAERTDIVADGQTALEYFRSEQYDMVLMDINMPIMNGLEVTRNMRNWELAQNLKRTPIIGISAHAQQEDKNKALASGMDGYVAKPVDEAVLHALIAEVLEAEQPS